MRKAPVFDGLDVIAHAPPFSEVFLMPVRKPGIGTAEQFGDLAFRYDPILHERVFQRFVFRVGTTPAIFFAESEAHANEIADWAHALHDMGHAMYRREQERRALLDHLAYELWCCVQSRILGDARELARELLDVLG